MALDNEEVQDQQELATLEAAISDVVANEQAVEAQPETDQTQEPQVEQVQEKLGEIYKETDAAVNKGDDLPPDDVLQDRDKLKEWINHHTESAITKTRQKDSAKVKDFMNELESKALFTEPPKVAQIDSPDIEDVRKKLINEENKDEMGPAVDALEQIATAKMKPLLQMAEQTKAEQRRQNEILKVERFKEVFPEFSRQRFEQMWQDAKAYQSQNANNPMVGNATVTDILYDLNRQELEDHKINRKVEQLVSARLNERPEHPGGGTAVSEARTPEAINHETMNDEDFTKFMEKNLGVLPE